MLPEGGSLPGPETGLLSNTGKWIIWGDTCAVKARDFIGKRQPGGEPQGRGAQENSSPALSQPRVLRDGLSFRFVFSQSFWVGVLPGGARLVQPRWPTEGRILGGGWMSGVSFWPFLNSSGWWWLSVLCSLSGPPVVKQLMQVVTVVPGQGGQLQSRCLP